MNNPRTYRFLISAVCLGLAGSLVSAQTNAQAQLKKGQALWNQRLSKSAIAALEGAAKDKSTAAAANEALGRIYTFKGWQQEGVFPGWHDEPTYREKALAALRAAVAADPARASAKEALKTAEGFATAEKVDPAPPRPEVHALDEKLNALTVTAPTTQVAAAVEARAKAQADPQPYFTGAQMMIDHSEYDRAIAMAEKAEAAAEHFIDENLSAYQMEGKIQAARVRNRAIAADDIGWARFMKKDFAGAAAKLEESHRLSQGADFVNLAHLGDLNVVLKQPDKAREYYLDALTVAGADPKIRQRIIRELPAVRGNAGAGKPFVTWVTDEETRRRDARRAAALKSLVNRPLPALKLTTVDGKPYEPKELQGKVVLLNFFASWCGLCKAELPNIKTAYTKYQNNPNVKFLLVSIDEDSKRLDRYLANMKFPFPVVRANPADAEKTMGFDNLPDTLYVDKSGVVRYQVNGFDLFGDSPDRVVWFVDQLLK